MSSRVSTEIQDASSDSEDDELPCVIGESASSPIRLESVRCGSSREVAAWWVRRWVTKEWQQN